MQRRIFGIVAVIVFMSFEGAAYGATSCANPSMNALLASYAKQHKEEDYYPSALATGPVVAEVNGIVVQWFGIQWEGPPGGVLYVLGCDGKVLAMDEIGAVFNIYAGPTLPSTGETVVVEYIEGSGTGGEIQSVSILSLHEMKIHALWRHDFRSYQFVMPDEEHWKTNFTVKFSATGDRVEAIGTKEIYHPDTDYDAKPDDVKQIREVACWSKKQLRYIGCGLPP